MKDITTSDTKKITARRMREDLTMRSESGKNSQGCDVNGINMRTSLAYKVWGTK